MAVWKRLETREETIRQQDIKTIYMSAGKIYLESVQKQFSSLRAQGDKTFSQLEERDFFVIPAPGSNSLATIIRHLHGNMMSRFTNFLTEDGEKEWRRRDQEFEPYTADEQPGSQELAGWWNEGWDCLFSTLEKLGPEDLGKTVTIRSEPQIVLDAINRQLAHYAMHVGQILYIGKMIKGNAWISPTIAVGGSAAFTEEMKARQNKN